MGSEYRIETLDSSNLNLFQSLLDVFERVFEMPTFEKPDDAYLNALLKDSEFHVFVVLRDNKVVGGLTAYTLKQYYLKRPLAYIYDLALEKHLQRQGIGTALINYCLAYFKKMDYDEVFVQADRPDDYALDFYRKNNPSGEEDVVHFTYQL